MATSFLLALREGLEAALIIGILLGVLAKLHRMDLIRTIWLGAASALAASLLVAAGLNLVGLQFEGRAEEIFEGVVMLLAAGILTWMIFWMQQYAGTLKQEFENKARVAIKKSGMALFAVAFLAIFREGVELALFLLAVGQTASPLQTALGAITGLVGATLLGWVLFSSTRRLSLRNFFKVTNVLLILFAAGLVAYGVHEFNEAGIIPPVIEHVWDINPILSDSSEVGQLLKALVGYNGNPSLTEVLAYVAYLTGISYYVIKRAPRFSRPAISVVD